MKTVKTPKGTDLPLVNLKGKDYLMVAHRIQWMNEEVPFFDIQTDIIKHDKDESVVRTKVTLLREDKNGNLFPYKSSTATKREDSKGFADHLEKAETSSCGRALAMLGFGTQFALADLDEGERLADSPVVSTKTQTVVKDDFDSETRTAPKPKTSENGTSNKVTFRKPSPPTTKAKTDDGEWS